MEKAIQFETEEKIDASGHVLRLCIAHELKEGEQYSRQAVAILGGMSLCREHFDKMVEYLKAGKPTTLVMIDILNGEF